MALEKKHKEPLFHVVKRMNMSNGTKIGIRISSVLFGLIVGAIFVVAFSTKSHNFFGFFGSLFNGVFATDRKIWTFLRDGAILLGVSIALIPAFKMKFWNLGGNGQILMGCLARCAFMYYLGGEFNDVVILVFEIPGSIIAGAIWALIPAIFKAFFKTNESLFTLMLNYIASILVAVTISTWYPGGTGTMNPISYGRLPSLGTSQFGKN
ncbi:MAG: ABC transporter permease, partial [Bacilli bacterium]|nr:ABC transporter permease [Bacilli bacterium]